MLFRAQQNMISVSRILSLAVLFPVVTAGCDSALVQEDDPDFSATVNNEVLTKGDLKIEEISRGHSGDIQGTTSVIRDEDTYATFWKQLHADQSTIPERPTIDFESEVVIAVVLEEKPTGGYRVGIDEVVASQSREQIKVRFTETKPGDECGTTLALTTPYILAAAETQASDFTFSKSTETSSCGE